MILLIPAFLFYILGGYCRGIFECVTIMKTMSEWWKKVVWVKNMPYYYWGYDLFVLNKDRNGDGKASWWEKTFPNDGGHRIKLVELSCYAIGSVFLLTSGLKFDPYWYICYPVLTFFIWWVISIGFEISFNKYKNKPV